jgi:hypothetical protein
MRRCSKQPGKMSIPQAFINLDPSDAEVVVAQYYTSDSSESD